MGGGGPNPGPSAILDCGLWHVKEKSSTYSTVVPDSNFDKGEGCTSPADEIQKCNFFHLYRNGAIRSGNPRPPDSLNLDQNQERTSRCHR